MEVSGGGGWAHHWPSLSLYLVRGRSFPQRIPSSHWQASASSTSAAAEKLQDWSGLATFIQMPLAATFDLRLVGVDGVKSSRVSFLPPAAPSRSIGGVILMSWQMWLGRWDDEAVNEGCISSQSFRPSCCLPKGFSTPVWLGSAITLCDSTTVAPTWCGTRDSRHILCFSSWRHLKAASSGGGFFDIKKERKKKTRVRWHYNLEEPLLNLLLSSSLHEDKCFACTTRGWIKEDRRLRFTAAGERSCCGGNTRTWRNTWDVSDICPVWFSYLLGTYWRGNEPGNGRNQPLVRHRVQVLKAPTPCSPKGSLGSLIVLAFAWALANSVV